MEIVFVEIDNVSGFVRPALRFGARTLSSPESTRIADDDDALAQDRPGEIAHCRNEKQQADDVGNEAGQHQEEGGDDNHGAMHHLPAGIAAIAAFGRDALENADPLDPQKSGTEQHAEDDEPQCGPDADHLSDDDESGNFCQRHQRNEDRKK